MQSAFPLFDDDRVDNVFVNFGPPSQWMKSTDNGANEGLQALIKMDSFDFQIRMLATSSVYHEFAETINTSNKNFFILKDRFSWKKLINKMTTANGGCHLWFLRNPTEMDSSMKPIKNAAEDENGGSWLRI